MQRAYARASARAYACTDEHSTPLVTLRSLDAWFVTQCADETIAAHGGCLRHRLTVRCLQIHPSRAVAGPDRAWSATPPGIGRGSAARNDLLKGFGAQVRRLAVDREPVEDLAVPVHLVALVQVQGADQLLDVGHVGQLRLGEPQDAEGAALRRVAAEPERHDLDRHVLQLAQLQQ